MTDTDHMPDTGYILDTAINLEYEADEIYSDIKSLQKDYRDELVDWITNGTEISKHQMECIARDINKLSQKHERLVMARKLIKRKFHV